MRLLCLGTFFVKRGEIMKNGFDMIDEKILSLLQENARMSIKDIAS